MWEVGEGCEEAERPHYYEMNSEKEKA